MKKLLIYLAGPDVFRANTLEHFAEMKKLCDKYDFEGMSPFDNEDNFKGELFSKPHSRRVFHANVGVVKICDAIIANLIPFRGACVDDGTAWEIGCGYAYRKLLYGYSPYWNLTLPELTRTTLYSEYIKDSDFPHIETFGKNCVNLMIQESIELTGGKILDTFENCLIDLLKRYEDGFIS